VVSIAGSAYKSILIELSQLSPGLAKDITRPGSASENTIYADLAFAASSPGLEKMAILNHIY
jgi:hypothetical protein